MTLLKKCILRFSLSSGDVELVKILNILWKKKSNWIQIFFLRRCPTYLELKKSNLQSLTLMHVARLMHVSLVPHGNQIRIEKIVPRIFIPSNPKFQYYCWFYENWNWSYRNIEKNGVLSKHLFLLKIFFMAEMFPLEPSNI